MRRCKLNRLIRALAITLISTAGLYGLTSMTPADAGIYPNPGVLDNEDCMANEYLNRAYGKLSQGYINCTANDVEITKVIPVDENGKRPGEQGYQQVECEAGQTFTLHADLTVRTNANERWDTTFYLPLGDYDPSYVQTNPENLCSLLIPIPDDEPNQLADVNLDGDQCGDITKALGPDEYTLYDEVFTMACEPSGTDPTRAEFTYCAAWDNTDDTVCYSADPPGAVPNNKAKCGCDTFPIDVFIKPPAPAITKTAIAPTERTEPGGDYAFTLSFTHPATASSSLFLTSLVDHVDIGSDGSYDTALNLWGATQTVDPTDPLVAEGVYLKSTSPSCAQPANGGEVTPGTTFSCTFTVTIVDRDLPDIPLTPEELYKDVVALHLNDKNGNPVIDGTSCVTAGLYATPVDGDHCSNTQTVKVTNVSPTITVSKTPSVTEVLEPGADVIFTIVVTSTAGNYDNPLTLTSLMDTDFGNLNGEGDCATGASVYLGSPYSCSFTKFIAGDAGDVHSNTVTAKAVDNENDEAQASDSATVNINDVPSNITLVKTANPIEVLETGDDSSLYRDVAYTFEFSVLATGVDKVTFSQLDDDKFGDLTGDCMVDSKNGSAITPVALNGFVLSPGEYASCTITEKLQGNAGDTHTNVADIYGTDEDGQAVKASDDADVTFTNAPLDIAPQFAIKARAFVHLVNGGVDNATITTLTIKGTNLVAGAGSEAAGFEILDETPSYTYQASDGPYAFCATGVVIPPAGSYDCAFTIKLYPGFLPATDDVSFSALGLDALTVTLEDNDGSSTTKTMGIEVYTVE